MTATDKGQIRFQNPEGLHKNPAFTQMVTVSGPVRTICIGAQVPVNGEGVIIGKGDIRAQTEQILANIGACLQAANARPENLIQWRIYVAEGQDMRPAFEAGMQWWGDRPNPPLNTVMYVSGFWPADFLISIEAVAVVPE